MAIINPLNTASTMEQKTFKMENMVDEEMYVLVAPDGTPQLMTLAQDFPTCVGVIKLMHQNKISDSMSKLLFKGFKILPVKVSIIQNGDENTPFKPQTNE